MMSLFKKVGEYLIWLIVSIIMGMSCILVELRLRSLTNSSFFDFLNSFLVATIIVFIGGIIGLVTFTFFAPLHVYVIKKKYQIKRKRIVSSIVTILSLAILFTIIHYLLEFELDWI